MSLEEIKELFGRYSTLARLIQKVYQKNEMMRFKEFEEINNEIFRLMDNDSK